MHYPFFVYGTLKPGEPNYTRLVVGRVSGEEPASLGGAALYTAGAYPFLVVEPDLAALADRVSGTLISVPDTGYAAMIADLDVLEGYVEGGTANTYERLLITVDTADGPRTAWIYVAGDEALAQIRAGELRRLPNGNWQSDSAAREYWSER
ncbi:MAG: gamma-glutamylcyclotransferase [Oscillochloris sp.]|nr:gamma-glutamylcyclotransferase [Oscillochloris sp.]